jgi:hypothetical protein
LIEVVSLLVVSELQDDTQSAEYFNLAGHRDALDSVTPTRTRYAAPRDCQLPDSLHGR